MNVVLSVTFANLVRLLLGQVTSRASRAKERGSAESVRGGEMAKRGDGWRAVMARLVGLTVLVGGAGVPFAGGGQVAPLMSVPGNCGPMPPMTCVTRWTCGIDVSSAPLDERLSEGEIP